MRLRSKFFAALVWASVFSASAAQETPANRTALIFEPYAAPTGPGCAVGVSVGGVTVFSGGYGAADLTWQVPITPDTVFDVASVSKQFVAFAALAAEEQGLLSLDDPIGRYVPEVRPPVSSATLRQLVTHTSGLPTYDAIALVNGRPTMSELDIASTLALVGRIDRLDFEPGSQFGYSNTNYFLLSLAIERTSGKLLQDFLRNEVFARAGMTRSLYEPDPGVFTVQKATAYQPTPTGFRIGSGVGADGGHRGVQTTVLDLLRWAEALDAGRLGAAAERMTEPARLNDGSVLRYAAGLFVETLDGRPVIRHGGLDRRGYTAELIRSTQDQVAVAVACNRADARADVLAERVLEVWSPAPVPAAPAPPLSDAHRAAVGRYVADDGRTLELRLENDRITARGFASGSLTPVDARTLTYGATSFGASLTVQEDTVLAASHGQAPVVLQRYVPLELTQAELREYEGDYISQSYGGLFEIRVRDDGLHMTDATGIARRLSPTVQDRFAIGGSTGFTFERDREGRVSRLVVAQQRARRLVFERRTAD